jgi:hypothetical protein
LEELQKIIEGLIVEAGVGDHGLDASRVVKLHERRL